MELKDISELFLISRKAALVLASLLMICNYAQDIVKIHVISTEDLTLGICLDLSTTVDL